MEKAARWVRRAGVLIAWKWRRLVARMKDMVDGDGLSDVFEYLNRLNGIDKFV